MNFIRDFLSRPKIKKFSGAYLSPPIATQTANSGKVLQTKTEERDLTAFFCSIHSFVTLTEQIPIAQLPELLNVYFTTAVETIHAEGGTLDKYIGDVVVAMFGAPANLSDHALHACVAALKIQNQIADLRKKLQYEAGKWPEIVHGLRIRIGLHSGRAIVGNIGTPTRYQYTMLGDDVNLAARCESGAKQWGVWTLCTGTTKQACERAQPRRILFRSLGPILAKDHADLLELFEPVSLLEDTTDELRECVRLFEEGLARYLTQDWEGAEAFFRSSAELEPNQPGKTLGVTSNPSLVFISNCGYLRAHPPSADWSGIFFKND